MSKRYESANLIEVGRADEVILGIITPGADLDGTFMIPTFEFEVSDGSMGDE